MSVLSYYLTRVAAAYARAEHAPSNAEISGAYKALSVALTEQYRLLTAFVDVSFVDTDPYPLSAPMWEDIERGKLRVYKFADMPYDHPMGLPARLVTAHGLSIRGEDITVNLAFRAVHDAFAHYPERLYHDGLDREPGYDEFRAFQAHVRLLCGNGPAIRALFTETVAQNATFHYGANPHAFAAQKAVLLPEALIMEGLALEI